MNIIHTGYLHWAANRKFETLSASARASMETAEKCRKVAGHRYMPMNAMH